jgi:hypothetical protein
MVTKTTKGESSAENQDGSLVSYEAPVLTPIGSLHDLLAGGGTQSCDMGAPDPSGGPQPFGTC